MGKCFTTENKRVKKDHLVWGPPRCLAGETRMTYPTRSIPLWTKTTQLLCPWEASEMVHSKEPSLFQPFGYLRTIILLTQRTPGLIWPDDHPTTVVVKSTFEGLVIASGVDPAGWKIYIANAPG
jgi:hypothetical protein